MLRPNPRAWTSLSCGSLGSHCRAPGLSHFPPLLLWFWVWVPGPRGPFQVWVQQFKPTPGSPKGGFGSLSPPLNHACSCKALTHSISLLECSTAAHTQHNEGRPAHCPPRPLLGLRGAPGRQALHGKGSIHILYSTPALSIRSASTEAAPAAGRAAHCCI